jgi:hypothetical protein
VCREFLPASSLLARQDANDLNQYTDITPAESQPKSPAVTTTSISPTTAMGGGIEQKRGH